MSNELKHQMDLHVSRANQRIEQGENERRDLWNKYNKFIDRGINDLIKRNEIHNKMRERITKIEKNDWWNF